jgi:hypothetical protein
MPTTTYKVSLAALPQHAEELLTQGHRLALVAAHIDETGMVGTIQRQVIVGNVALVWLLLAALSGGGEIAAALRTTALRPYERPLAILGLT